jgi:hypothetical protein
MPSQEFLAQLGDVFWLGPVALGAVSALGVLLCACYAALRRRSMPFTPISLAGFWSMMTSVFAAALRDSTRETAGWIGPIIAIGIVVAMWTIVSHTRRAMRTAVQQDQREMTSAKA